MKDVTGQPLKLEDVYRLRAVILKNMINITRLPSDLAVEMLTLKLAIDELIEHKQKLKGNS